MSPRDIALIAPYPQLGERHGGNSGAASYTANLAHALTDAGARVTVVAPTEPGTRRSTAEHDGSIRILRSFELGPAALPRAAAVATSLRVDVVHLQWELFLYGRAALAGLAPGLTQLRRGSAPLVTTVHQVLDPADIDRRTTELHRVPVPAVAARWGIGGVQRLLGEASHATIVHERPFRDFVPGAVVIPHGVETRPHVDRRVARRMLGLDGRLVVLCFGFLAPYKGLELAADAAACAGDDVHVVFAGGDHPRLSGESFADQLERRSAGRASFTGWVPDHEVDAWFAGADLALFPYPRPFAASGAMALALAHDTPLMMSPALARCMSAPSPVVMPMRAAPLAETLDQIAADRAVLTSHAVWTQLLASDRAWPDVAERHLDLYEEVCDGRRPARGSLRAA